MKNNDQYIERRAVALQDGLNKCDERIKSETDFVLKEMACGMFDQRSQHMSNHAGRHPLEFAQLIVDGVIDTVWASGLFTGDYHTKKYRKQVKDILSKSDDPDLLWFVKNR